MNRRAAWLRQHASRLQRQAGLAATVLPWRIRSAAQAAGRTGFLCAGLVTFDVFDTALYRRVALPADAFWLAAWRVNQRLGCALDIEATAQARIAAEQRARAQARQAGRFETTLAEIYLELGCDASLRAALVNEEIATERDICTANPDILALFNSLVSRGTKIAFVTDTYLDHGFVGELLQAAGYAGDYRVFASSAFGLSKADGNLFGAVADAAGCQAAQIWHIGDNAVADVRRARACGWNALWYKPRLHDPGTAVRGTQGVARIAASLLAGIPAILAAGQPPDDAPTGAADIWQRIGAGIAGPCCLGFAQFVADAAARLGAGRVAFCARDGLIVREVYRRLQASRPELPESLYFMVSRRALVFPMIRQLGEAELDFLTGQFASLPVAEVLTRIGLEAGGRQPALAAHGLTPQTLIATPDEKARLRAFLRAIAGDIVAAAARERDLLAAYMRQEGCLDCQDLAFVDIGWQGSLQQAAGRLIAALGHATRLHGLYFGTTPKILGLDGTAGSARGWFVDAGQPPERYDLTQTQWAVLELLFTAEHGSVLGYARNGAHIEAVLDEAAARPLPDYGKAPSEKALYKRAPHEQAPYQQAAARIQQAGLAMIDHWLAAFGGLAPVALTPAAVEPGLRRLLQSPTLAEARAIGDLFHVDGFGATRTGQYIARPPLASWLPSVPGVLRGYRAASWRRGYLVRVLGGPRAALAAVAALGALRPGIRG